MISRKKTLRYYYWLILEFSKKNIKLFAVSFLLSIISIVGFLSITPYISDNFLQSRTVIGIVGNYDLNAIPDEIASKISNGLIFIGNKGEIIPALASTWEITNNGTEYRFLLKNGLVWNDGKPFTASEIGYQFKDVQVLLNGDKSIRFLLKKPLTIFPTYLSKPIVKYPFVGVAGLYKVEKYRLKYDIIKELSLVPNKKGLPVLLYKFFDNETLMINAYKLGEINQMTMTKKTVADSFGAWKNTSVTKEVDYSHLLTLFMNLNNTSLKEKEVRQAIAMAINRDELIDYGIDANSPIPPISWAYNPNLKKTLYDKQMAEDVLRKVTPATQSAELNFDTYYDYLDVANVIQGALLSAGLKTNLNIISGGQDKSFDFLLAYFKVPTDPDQYYFWHSTQTSQGNITGYKNLKVDKLLEDGRSTLSLKDRRQIYFDFQKNIVDDTPAVFLYFPYMYTVKRK